MYYIYIYIYIYIYCSTFSFIIGLFYLFTHSDTYVTLDTSVTDNNLQHNLQYIDITQYNIINNNTKFKAQLQVEFVTTSRYLFV